MSKKRRTMRGVVSKSMERRRKEASSYGYLKLPKDVKMLSPEEGTRELILDFIPYEVTNEKHPDRADGAVPGNIYWRSPFKVHRDIGTEGRTVVCPTTIGKPCPVCEYMAKLRKEGVDWETIKAYRPSPRALYSIIPIDLKGHDEAIYIWDVSDYLFYNELDDYLQNHEEDEVFVDLYEGKTANLRLKWKELGQNKYYEAIILGFEDREAYDEEVVDDVPKLDDLLDIMSYKDLESIFLMDAEAVEKEEIEEEIEEERPRRRSYKRKEEVKEEVDDSDNEELSEAADEKEEPKPPKKPGRKPGRKPATRKPQPKKDEEERCPHGHRFGVDTDKFDECASCTLWDDCYDEKEDNQ